MLISDEFPESFDPTRCILFLGAGFSASAVNKAGTNPPVGKGLELAIKHLVDIPIDDPVDFSDAAGYAISKNFDLYGLLEGLYTVRVLTDHQRKVLSHPWCRVYTTNYDNSVSVFRAESGGNATNDIFDLTDTAPKQLRAGSVIHLHGSIAKCKPDSIDSSLVLSRRSYVQQRVKKSPWWDWFDRDIRISQYIFFLGYDLNDFEPASYLIQYPGMKDRRHFILRNAKSQVSLSKLEDFGVRHSFEMKGFADRLVRAKVTPAPTHERALSAFRYVDLTKDNKLPTKPTSAEIQELFAFGLLRFDGIKATIPESEYAVYRSGAIELCKTALLSSKTLVIHGKIGNGKSILGDELKVVLTQGGARCFELRDNITPPPQEIEYLRTIKSGVIFFPNYDSAFVNMHLFTGLHESTRYVVELPTNTLQVRLQEVEKVLPGKISKVSVDKLDRSDITSLRALLSKAGLSSLARSPQLKERLEFRDFLLMSYDDPEVARRLKAVIEPLLRNGAARRVICASAIIKAAGQPVDTGFLEEATDEDPYSILSGLGEAVLELMDFGIDKLEPHSSVLSEHILKKYVSTSDALSEIFNLAAEAARRIDETDNFSTERFRRARSLLSSILRFGFVESIVGRSPEKLKLINKLYESCRRDDLIKKEPLFWLQYSIFWKDVPRWDLAESHMIEAYSRGAMRPGFKTFQLDTNYLGLLCDLEVNSIVGQPVARFEKLIEMMEVCRLMIDDGNHRDHVTKAFLKLEPMIIRRKGDFTKPQATSLTHALNLVIQKLDGLTPVEKSLWGTEAGKGSLVNCVKILTRQNYR